MTANLYLPARTGRHPAILAPLRHSENGKAWPSYQKLFSNLARKGYVVLAFTTRSAKGNGDGTLGRRPGESVRHRRAASSPRRKAGYRPEQFELTSDSEIRTPGWLLIPDAAGPSPPTVLYVGEAPAWSSVAERACRAYCTREGCRIAVVEREGTGRLLRCAGSTAAPSL